MQLLEKKISDQRFLELIRKALNAGYMNAEIRETDIIGTPQGSVISPVLSNIFLHELDAYVEQLKNAFDSTKSTYRPRTRESNQYKYLIQKAKGIEDPKTRAQEVSKYASLMRSVTNKTVGNHTLSRSLMYVRYADD